MCIVNLHGNYDMCVSQTYFTNLFHKLILPWNRRNTYYSPNKPILMVDRLLRRESKV